MGLLEHVREDRSVDGGDDEDLAALRDHVLQLLDLRIDVVVGVLEVDLVALGLEEGLHVGAVLVPALQRLRGHGHTDEHTLAIGRGESDQHGQDDDEEFLHYLCLLKTIDMPIKTDIRFELRVDANSGGYYGED